MVIKYADTIKPNLNDLNVVDKRDDVGSSNSSGSSNTTTSSTSSSGSSSNSSGDGLDQAVSAQSEREIIKQRGTQGLKEIKKERLEGWLVNTDGVGEQTLSRIMMVFDRNRTVHTNPDVLYNLLDQELNAGATYINTIVNDVFQPEDEHSDVLQSKGYSPYGERGHDMNQHGSMGSSGYNPSFGGQPQQMQPQQSQSPQPQQTQQSQGSQGSQQSNSSSSSSGISREEAEAMVRESMEASQGNSRGGALLDGLSDATDEAIREAASNIGGLAGTAQRVVESALVAKAQKDPEWVLENMGMLQTVLEASDDGESQEPQQAEQDAQIDEALADLGGGMGNSQGGNNQQQTSQHTQQVQEPEPQATQETQQPNEQTYSSGGHMSASPPQEQQSEQSQQAQASGGLDSFNQTDTQEPVEETQQDPDPDLSDEHFEESGFQPQEEEERITLDDVRGAPPDAPKPDGEAAQKSQDKKQEFETKVSEDQSSEQSNTEQQREEDQSEEQVFDEIFGESVTE